MNKMDAVVVVNTPNLYNVHYTYARTTALFNMQLIYNTL